MARDDADVSVRGGLERPHLVVAAVDRPLNDRRDVVEQCTEDVERLPAVARDDPNGAAAGRLEPPLSFATPGSSTGHRRDSVRDAPYTSRHLPLLRETIW